MAEFTVVVSRVATLRTDGWLAEGVDFFGRGLAVGGGSHKGLFISHGYFIKDFFCTGDGDIGEIVFLVEHPVLGCEFARHPGVATEEVDGGPFEAFRFMDGRECEFGWSFGIVVGEELFEGLKEDC